VDVAVDRVGLTTGSLSVSWTSIIKYVYHGPEADATPIPDEIAR
jgi:hypothetical protein